MTITIRSEGRRHYLVGDTYPIRNELRAAGCKWDRDQGAWWTGKRETAEALVSRVESGDVEVLASFAKLANGQWGVRVSGNPTPGAKVEVEGKYGRKTVTIAAVIETRDGSSICSIVAEPRKACRSGGRSGDGRSFRRGDRDYNTALRNYRASGDYYGSGLYDEES